MPDGPIASAPVAAAEEDEGGVRLGEARFDCCCCSDPVARRWAAILEGRVLLRCTPPAVVPGLGALLEVREVLDETETFLRRLPYLRKLSAPPLALETERRTPPVFWAAELPPPPAAVETRGAPPLPPPPPTAPPDSTALTVSSSAAVPFIPNRK